MIQPCKPSSPSNANERQAVRRFKTPTTSKSTTESSPCALLPLVQRPFRIGKGSMLSVISVLIICCCCRCPIAIADWIDPDTPLDAYTTDPFPLRPPQPAPPAAQTSSNTDDISPNGTHSFKHNRTAAPTISHAPTKAPTPRPTPFPTVTSGTYKLVYSDEFNTPYRTFEDGADPRWTALNKNDYSNDALHYYSPNNAITQDGFLIITTEAVDTPVVGFDDVTRQKTRVTKHFRSAMLQSWNKFCFTGGIIEAEAILPGQPRVGGLWPAFWLLGNLARHTYAASSEHVWPWSSTGCFVKNREAQRMSGCSEVLHYGLESFVGRGAPEVDIFEVQPGNIPGGTGAFLKTPVGQPFMSASYQVAPGRSYNRPGPGWWPGPGQWYEGLQGGNATAPNILFYGNYNHYKADPHPAKQDYWSDAVSFNRQLDDDYFRSPHVYRLEWQVPNATENGSLRWFLDGELVLSIDGTGLKNAGFGAEITSEPSYVLLNTAVSSQWGFPMQCPDDCPCKEYDCHSHEWEQQCGFSSGFCKMMTNEDNHSPQYKINWVRVYQDPTIDAQKVGCSTPERPTRKYIEAHEAMYKLDTDDHPLLGIQQGRGICDPKAVGELPEACGGHVRGRCTQGKVCECFVGWTGPFCLAHDGTDPILYDVPDRIADVGFDPPGVAPTGLLIGLGLLLLLLLVGVQWRRSMQGWTAIPDVEKKHLRYQ